MENIDGLKASVLNGVFILYESALPVEFIVEGFTSKITRVSCKKGYLGFFLDRVRPGNTLYDLLKIHSDFEITNGVLASKKIDGIEIDIPEEFEDIDIISELPNFEIEKISCVAY